MILDKVLRNSQKKKTIRANTQFSKVAGINTTSIHNNSSNFYTLAMNNLKIKKKFHLQQH